MGKVKIPACQPESFHTRDWSADVPMFGKSGFFRKLVRDVAVFDGDVALALEFGEQSGQFVFCRFFAEKRVDGVGQRFSLRGRDGPSPTRIFTIAVTFSLSLAAAGTRSSGILARSFSRSTWILRDLRCLTSGSKPVSLEMMWNHASGSLADSSPIEQGCENREHFCRFLQF